MISRHGGFIDAFIGDAVMALFPSGPEGAVHAAVDIRIALRTFRYKSGSSEVVGIATGFGLHTGEVTLGTVGTDRRMQTTAIGDSVNLAARIESSTKLFGVNIIISSGLFDQLPNTTRFKLRSIDMVRVKGKQEVVELFEVFDADPPEILEKKLQSLGLFDEAMLHYREGDFQLAIEKLTLCQEICPEDTLPPIYLKRSNTMLRMPPGDGWTGVSTI
ncbi:MAG: adenylate/guanylate cyclase domain-containing protein [Proteobacteria bacterium]|nr:adenylate/guanylate cyclase domain-containing protein [Pseudomonadota bacterium]